MAEDGSFPSFLASTCVKEHASCFNGVCRIYAPKYRQARVSNFHMFEGEADPAGGHLPNYQTVKVGNAAFDVAYRDVEHAFEVYLEKWNGGRPFFLVLGPCTNFAIPHPSFSALLQVGHSQGSLHLARLLRKLEDRPEVLQKMIAAFLPGCQMGADTFGAKVPLGESPEQLGCYLTWCTVGAESKSTFATGRKRHGYVERSVMTEGPAWSVNPITWSPVLDIESDLEQHRGAATRESVHPKAVRASCMANGLVRVSAAESKVFSLRGFANKQGDFHVSDFALFWLDVRENAELRARAFLARHPVGVQCEAEGNARSRL